MNEDATVSPNISLGYQATPRGGGCMLPWEPKGLPLLELVIGGNFVPPIGGLVPTWAYETNAIVVAMGLIAHRVLR